MKLAQFYHPDQGHRVGVVDGRTVTDVTTSALPSTLAILRAADALRLPPAALLYEVLAEGGVGEGLYSFSELDVQPSMNEPHLMMPISPAVVWGAGVTYRRSASIRSGDSAKTIYDEVYEGERPELFPKATHPGDSVGPGGFIGIKSDSGLCAIEPEVAFAVGSRGDVLGYTICNDVSAWDIERSNPLFLPQSKTFYGACALGPVFVTADEIPDPYDLEIRAVIERDGETLHEGRTSTSEINRSFDVLAAFVTLDREIPAGTLVSTGTGIMVSNEHHLVEGDVVRITVEGIGTLMSTAKRIQGSDINLRYPLGCDRVRP
jgi:2-dehydro-3-deoxy-D-arabinonate dehydratase